jgi:hypothetical protein
LLVDQVEVANVIVLNKMDLMDAYPSKQQLLLSIITSLNPNATLVPASFSRVELSKILGTSLFSSSTCGVFSTSSSSNPSSIENRSFKSSVSGAAEIASFVYERRDRPFHPKRLHDLVCGWQQGSSQRILRAKGFVHVAGRREGSVFWSLAGNHLVLLEHTDPDAARRLAREASSTVTSTSTLSTLTGLTQVVFIGVKLQESAITEVLDECLMTNDEINEAKYRLSTFEESKGMETNDQSKLFEGNDPLNLRLEPWRETAQQREAVEALWMKRAFILAGFTIGYNLIEGIVSIYRGEEEEGISLVGFGVDSLIEVASACLVLRQLLLLLNPEEEMKTNLLLKQLMDQEHTNSLEFLMNKIKFTNKDPYKKERQFTLSIGVLLILLATSALVVAILNLTFEKGPEAALSGLIVASASLSFMFGLWATKVYAAVALDSSVLLADAACSLGCIQLSVVLLFSSIIFMVFGDKAWWVDSVAALCISLFIFNEGRHVCQSAFSNEFSGSACDCSTHLSHPDQESSSQLSTSKKKNGSCYSMLLGCYQSILSSLKLNEWLYNIAWNQLRTSSGALRLPPPSDVPHNGQRYTESIQNDDDDSDSDDDDDKNKDKDYNKYGFKIIDMDVIQKKYEETQKLKEINEGVINVSPLAGEVKEEKKSGG